MRRPFEPVGIFNNPLGGTPFILLSDTSHFLVGFTLSGGAFLETFRLQDDNRFMRSAPAILADHHAIIGTEDVKRDATFGPRGAYAGGVLFSGPNMNKLAPVTGLKAIYATPTRLADGRAVLIELNWSCSTVAMSSKVALAEQRFASPPRPRRATHLFVYDRCAPDLRSPRR